MTTVLTCTRADNVSLSNIIDVGQVNLTIHNDMTKSTYLCQSQQR